MSDSKVQKKPKYRRHSSRDKAFVEVKGKRIYFPGRHNSPESLAAYKAFVEGDGGTKPRDLREGKPDVITLGFLAEHFLDHAKDYYGDGPRSTYAAFRRAIAYVASTKTGLRWRHLPAEEFGPLKLKLLQDHLVRRGLARSTINGITSKIKTWFKWCVSEEMIPAGTWHALQSVKGLEAGRSQAKEPAPREKVDWEDVEPVFEHLPAIPAAMLWLQWYTGARSSSICQAKREQFIWAGDVLQWRPKHKTEYRGHEVVLPIGPRCYKILKPYLEGRNPKDFMFSPREGRRGSNRRYKQHYEPYTYRQAIKRAQQNAIKTAKEQGGRIPVEWTPHQLRHARGTLVREKHGVEAAQAILGHESLQATQIYAERRLELATRIALEDG